MNIKTSGLVLSMALFGLSNTAEAAPTAPTVRVVTPFAAGHILADVAYKYKHLLENRGFTVTVETAKLTEQTIGAQMTSCDASGRVGDVLLSGGQPLQDWAPTYFFFNGPYVIADWDHFQSVWYSHLGDEARALMSQNGNMTTVGAVYRGYRQFTSNKAINGPADFAGLKLRLPGVPDWISVWSSLGVTPVTVPLGGIYEALRTGVAEASEGDLTQIQSLKLYEVQSHLTLTNHLVGFGVVMANNCFLSGLSSSERNKVTHELQAAISWGTGQIEANEAALLSQLQAAGMTVVTPNADAIRTAARPAIEQLFTTKWYVTTWDEILSM